ncbi:hypothetical protein D3C83_280450 [compost metagenome]
MIDVLRCHVEHELHEEIAHLLEILTAHALLLDPEGLVHARRDDDDALLAGEPDRKEREH